MRFAQQLKTWLESVIWWMFFLFFYFLDVSTSYYPLYIGPEESSITDYLSVNLFL